MGTVVLLYQLDDLEARSIPPRCSSERPNRLTYPRALNLVESQHIRGLDKTSEIDGIPHDALDLAARFARHSTTLRGGRRMAARVLHWMMRRKIQCPTRASMRSWHGSLRLNDYNSSHVCVCCLKFPETETTEASGQRQHHVAILRTLLTVKSSCSRHWSTIHCRRGGRFPAAGPRYACIVKTYMWQYYEKGRAVQTCSECGQKQMRAVTVELSSIDFLPVKAL